MITSLIYIRISAQAPTTYSVPLLARLKESFPHLSTFEFDNFSEESIRQYALELLKQSGRAAVIVEVAAADAPVTGLSSFFNRLLKVKPPVLLMALQGEQPMLQKMMQHAAGEQFYQHLPEAELQDLMQQLLS